jgi:hypothetical protein
VNSHSYVQFFRSGAVEAAYPIDNGTAPILYPADFEPRPISFLPVLLGFYEMNGVSPPIVLYLSLVGTSGMALLHNTTGTPSNVSEKIDDVCIALPETIIEDYAAAAAHVLQPSIDMIWNAFGLERSFSYDLRGNYRGS